MKEGEAAVYYITFQQIEAFLTTARLLNISLAAEKLCISQPTLSKTLQRFENGIGYAVFSRSNRGIALTSEGKYLLDAFESVYANMEAAIRKAREYGSTIEKSFTINAPITYDLNRDYETAKSLVDRYSREYPDVVINEYLYDFDDLIQQLEYGNADVTFIHDFLAEDVPDIEYRRISVLPMFIAMSEKHPLAKYDVLPPEELGKYDFAAIRYKEASEKDVIKNCKLYGFMPKNIVMTDNFQTWMNFICRHNGISIGAKSVDMAGRPLKFYPFPKSHYTLAAWRTDNPSKQLKDFIALLDEKGLPEK